MSAGTRCAFLLLQLVCIYGNDFLHRWRACQAASGFCVATRLQQRSRAATPSLDRKGCAWRPLLAAVLAVAADFRACDGDLDAAVALDLALELLEQPALELAHFAAAQAGDVDVVAGPVTFVVVLVATDMEQVQLVDQAVALEQIERAVHSDAVHARINLLRVPQDGASVEVPLGVIHHGEQHTPLPGETHAAAFERGFQAARLGVSVDTLASRNAPSQGCGHLSFPYRAARDRRAHDPERAVNG